MTAKPDRIWTVSVWFTEDKREKANFTAHSASAAKYACYRAMREAGYARGGFWPWVQFCDPQVWLA